MMFYLPGWWSNNGHIKNCFSKVHFGWKEGFSSKVLALSALPQLSIGAGTCHSVNLSLSIHMCKMNNIIHKVVVRRFKKLEYCKDFVCCLVHCMSLWNGVPSRILTPVTIIRTFCQRHVYQLHRGIKHTVSDSSPVFNFSLHIDARTGAKWLF